MYYYSSTQRILAFSMLPWLNLLLVTVTRILHAFEPRTDSFAFQPGNNKANDRHIFQYLIWSQKEFGLHEPTWESGSVLVAYQPPFVLTVTDLEEFVSCKAVRILHKYKQSDFIC